MQLQIIIACAAVVIYLLWRLDQLRDRVRRLELESPLREVITVRVQLQREFFSEALKLSDEEIDRAPGMVGRWGRLRRSAAPASNRAVNSTLRSP